MNDRAFTIAFGISLACHALFLGWQFTQLARHPQRPPKALDVVYESRLVERQVRRLQDQLSELKEHRASLPEIKAPESRIRIPDRPVGVDASTLSGSVGQGQGIAARAPGELGGTLSEANATRAPVVDLTNLVDAAQGNPVLLSYFSAIREQIQRTANRNTWMTGNAGGGLIYVSFVLSATGQVQSASVLSDRSAPARPLQDVALRIIKASSPFPPFPPSIGDAAKTIVVPLEFLLGGS